MKLKQIKLTGLVITIIISIYLAFSMYSISGVAIDESWNYLQYRDVIASKDFYLLLSLVLALGFAISLFFKDKSTTKS